MRHETKFAPFFNVNNYKSNQSMSENMTLPLFKKNLPLPNISDPTPTNIKCSKQNIMPLPYHAHANKINYPDSYFLTCLNCT